MTKLLDKDEKERFIDHVEEALCDENTHVVVYLDSSYREEPIVDYVRVSESVEKVIEQNKDSYNNRRKQIAIIDLSEDIRPQIDAAEKVFVKECNKRR